MRRREFIAGLGSAATWPVVARAQQGERMRRVGVLMDLAADDPEVQARVPAFLQGLRQLGWIDGRNVRIDTRWGAGDADRIRKYAAEIAALAPEVILCHGSATLGPLLQVSRAVPVVFVAVIDPVGAGFVDSLARPGGNATGFTFLEYGTSREMAGTPQTDRAPRDASGGPAGPRRSLRDRPVCRNPDRGALAWGGVAPGRLARPR